MAAARIRVFGQLRIEREDGAECPPPPSRKARALLTYLLLHPGAELPRERLAGLFWGDSDERRARQSLRQALSEVRRSIDGLGGYARLDAGDHLVSLRVDCPVDVTEFLHDTAAVATGIPSGRLTSQQAEALTHGTEYPAGELLPECYDDWCVEERERLHERRLRALAALFVDARAAGDLARVQETGNALLAADPAREDVHRAIMETAARAGDRSAALRQYAACVAALERELGAAPSAETTRLYERIRDGTLGSAATPGGPTTLVGRDVELETILRAVQRAGPVSDSAGEHGGEPGGGVRGAAAARKPRAILLSGPAGIGKSRLAAEAGAAARIEGWHFVEVDAGGSGRPEPYGGWVAALRMLLLTDDTLVASVPPAVLLGVVRLIPETRHLLGRTALPEPTRADLFAGVVALLRAAAARRPLLLSFDDLHWADQDTLLLFEHVTRTAAGLPLVLIATARDDPGEMAEGFARMAGALREGGLVVDVPLAALPREAVHDLLRQLSGNEGIAASLTDIAYTETEGNPLHLGELWRVMREQGRLEQDASGRWRWHGGMIGSRERLPLPMRVRATVAGRISALDPMAREALTLGAIIGRAWTPGLLSALTGTPPAEWSLALDATVRRGLLRETVDGYSFAHDIIRETVERETDEAAARALHLRAGETLERRFADRLDERSDELARHFVMAGPRGVGRAFTYTRRAAERSRELFAHEQAIERFRLALDYAEGGLLTDPVAVAMLRLDLAEALARSGHMGEAEEMADRAFAAYAEAGDPRGGAEARARIAPLFDANVNPRIVVRMTGEAMAMLGVEDSELYAALMQLGAYALERMGQAAELRRAAETLYGIADRTGSEQIRLEAMRAESLWLSNYSLDQVACAEMRLKMSEGNERLGQPFAAMEAMSDAADSLVRVGAVRRARPVAEEAVARARRLQGAWAALATYPVLMELLVSTGEFAEIDSMFRELAPYLGEIPASGRALQMLSAKAAADQWRGIHTLDIAQVGSHVDPQGWREMQFITRIWSLWETGVHDEARTLLDQVAPIIPTEGEGMRWFINAYPFVYYYNLFGDPERASAWTGAMARHPDFCLPGGQARLELARTALLTNQLDTAARLLDEAVAHYEREGMRPLLALARMEQARLGFARGEISSARALLDRAEALFATLTMTPWVARVRALRREARLPA